MREAVVLVHGIWMVGLEMLGLKRSLRRQGFACHQFFYRSLVNTPRENARKLHRFLADIDADIVHLVAHSLGGVVVLHLFDCEPVQKPGHVLMLGTPLRASETARRLHARMFTRPLLGRAVHRGLLGNLPAWKGPRPLGMIAGTHALGVGTLLLGGLPGLSDGTITVNETCSPEVDVHLCVPCSHAGMLWSRPVAAAIGRFLRAGDFD